MSTPQDVILAVDIGGSKYITGLISQDGEIFSQKREVWEPDSSEYVMAALQKSMDADFEEAAAKGLRISAIGITIPGLADPKKGIWLSASYLGVYDLPIARLMKERYGCPVHIDNDSRACALAEKWLGAGKDSTDFVYMTVSTGVGGALFLNNQLYYGSYMSAGEVGECVVVEDGRVAQNDSQGTLEMYAGTRGLVGNYLEMGGQSLIDGKEPNGKSIARLADAGDPIAIKAYESIGYYLGKVIAYIWNILDVEKVILGGGLSLAFRLFEPKLMETLLKNSYVRDVPNIVVEATPLGYHGALLGAAALTVLTPESIEN